jgi:hypothetical protein
MPPLSLHVVTARRVADSLGLRSLDDERGSLYMGATAPDIRVITSWERERTHFFDLHRFDDQSGARAFLAANSGLADAASLSPATAAFVAGYLTHLEMDETWINSVYRPYFGERSSLGGTLRANIMDRALQFSLDARERDDRELMAEIVEAVLRCDFCWEISFIDADTLRRWHQLVVEMMSSEADWERFRSRAHRFAGNGVDPAELEELTRSLPDLVEEALRHLTPERVEEFKEDAYKRSLAAVKEYLRCA